MYPRFTFLFCKTHIKNSLSTPLGCLVPQQLRRSLRSRSLMHPGHCLQFCCRTITSEIQLYPHRLHKVDHQGDHHRHGDHRWKQMSRQPGNTTNGFHHCCWTYAKCCHPRCGVQTGYEKVPVQCWCLRQTVRCAAVTTPWKGPAYVLFNTIHHNY